jgi:hypothetical protein
MKNYRSSSAAFRAIRHYEAKHGKSNFTVEKLGKNDYIVKEGTNTISFDEFCEKLPVVRKIEGNTDYRYFTDGVNGEGYYEMKTGNRRRPNSLSLTLRGTYDGIIAKVFEVV